MRIIDNMNGLIVYFGQPDKPQLINAKGFCPTQNCNGKLLFWKFTDLSHIKRIDKHRYLVKLLDNPVCDNGHISTLEDFVRYEKMIQEITPEFKSPIQVYRIEQEHSVSLVNP